MGPAFQIGMEIVDEEIEHLLSHIERHGVDAGILQPAQGGEELDGIVDLFGAHDFSASTPGRSLPSSHSRKAPPAVEI